MLAARLAVETICAPFATGHFGAEQMRSYERDWKALLADELSLGLSFRKFYGWLSTRQVNQLVEAIARDGLKDLIRRKANFDWHRDLIAELGKSMPWGRLALSTLFSP